MKNKREKCVPVYVLAISFVAISSFLFSIILSNTYASSSSSVVDEITIDIPASCSLTNTVGSAHTATIETGVYQENIGETTFKVFCNDSEGFAVYVVGYTNDEFGNNTLKPAVVDNSNAVATGTATSGNTSNWAMKLSAVSGTYAPTIHSTEENSNTYSFTNYHTVPDEYIKVASYSSNTDVTTGSSFKSTYAAFISQTQLADSYTGKVKYTVVHPSSELAPIENIAQLTYMQDFKDLKADERTAVLNSMQYNTTYNLIDSRDNKTYQIARLKDDNIWMAENLDLGRTELTQDLTSQNTNLSETITAETFNGWIKSSGSASYTSAELIPLTTSNTSDGLDIDVASGTPYGTLYNYCATSAGTVCSASGKNNDDAINDICPSGWRLPTGGSSGEFRALYDMADYNSNAKMRTPIASGGAAFSLAGSFDSSTPAIQGSYGIYWSAVRGNYSTMYSLYMTSSSVTPNNSSYRYSGYAVRCVAKRPFRALTVSYGTGVSSVQLNGITIQNGGVVNLEEGVSYTIIVTPTEGYALSDWTSSSGSIGSNASETTTYTIGSDNATLTANAMLAIQNLDSSNCTSTASQVVDNRDAHIYTIQRLADGRCWMMENLDLGRTALTKDLTSTNTNLTATIYKSTFNNWRKTSGNGNPNSGEFISVEGTDSTSLTQYGTLYNYYAASAGTVSDNNTDDAKNDICPAGWRLPTGGSSGEFQALYTLYDSNVSIRTPVTDSGAAFALAGYFDHDSPDRQGEHGHYWSSTLNSNVSMHVFSINTTGVYPLDSYGRGGGLSIRCTLDETSIADLTYMQDFYSLTPAAKLSIKKSMADNTVYSLIDNRDNKSYQVARLKDNKIWMAENLDLGRLSITTDLTNDNTNLATSITATEFNSWRTTTGTSTLLNGEFIPIDGTDTIAHVPFGTLYNYYAASAGTMTSNNDISYDICSAGWKVPKSGDFITISNASNYNSSYKLLTSILDGGAGFVRAGYFSNGNPSGKNSEAIYWSSSSGGGSNALVLYISSNVSPANNHSRNAGYSVRCIVK